MTDTARATLVLALLCLTALALRLPGAGFRLPHVPVVDEVVIHRQTLTAAELDADPARAGLENCYPRLLGDLARLTRPAPRATPPRDATEHRDAAARDLMRARQVLAAFSVLLVPLTYRLARRFLRRGPALLAAALVAVSLLHVLYAPQARPHPAVAITSALAVLAACALQRRPTTARYVVAGLAVGLAIATLQSGLATLAALVVAHVVRAGRRGLGDHLRLAAALAASVAVALPFWPPAMERAIGRGGLFGHGVYLDRFDGGGFVRAPLVLFDYEPLMTLLAVAGVGLLALSLWRAGRARSPLAGDAAVVLSHAAAYLTPLLLYQELMQRFLIPVLPYLAILAAYGATELGARCARAFPAGRGRSAAALALPILLLAAEGALSGRVLLLRLRPDTETLAARWIEENARRGSDHIVLSPTLELPLLRSADLIPATRRGSRILFPLWTTYQSALPPEAARDAGWRIEDLPLGRRTDRAAFEADPGAWVRSLSANLFVLELLEPGRREILRELRGALEDAEVVARFDPAPCGPGPLLPHLDGPHAPERWFAWRVVCSTAIGPGIEILRRAP